MRFLGRALVASFVVLAATFVGCGADKASEGPTYCDVAREAAKTCADPSPCDTAVAGACAALPKVLSAPTLTQAQGCLESGVCGVASCLSRAQKGTAPTPAHKSLATDFCRSCAPDTQDCEAQFYRPGGKLPGLLVLPYSADVAKAVDDACTSGEGCQAKFRTCAMDAISAALGGSALAPDVTECVISGFSKDDGEQSGPGGKPQVTTCTAKNCQGCCHDDICEPGNTLAACGGGAAACEICSGAQKCLGGKCAEPCGPNNCAGCCDGDTCLPGTAKDKCGEKGGACGACAGTFICSKQKCIDGSCQATCSNGCCAGATCKPGSAVDACGFGGEACVDCGFGRRCAAGACLIDPNALWDVYVAFAYVPEKNKGGTSWDVLNGLCDPYVKAFSSGGGTSHSGTTTTKQDTRVPYWAETPLKGIKASELLSSFSFEIWDDDFDFDDFIGGCQVPLKAAIFDGSLQSVVCPATTTGVEVTLYYRINPHAP